MLGAMLGGCRGAKTTSEERLPTVGGVTAPEPAVEPGLGREARAPTEGRTSWQTRVPAGGTPEPRPWLFPRLEIGPATLPTPRRNEEGREKCAGIAQRRGQEVVVDGQPVFFFGFNAPFLLDPEFPESEVDRLLGELSSRGVNALRVWFFAHHDSDRFARLLDEGARHGIRFVVTLADNVFVGRDWFFGQDDEERYRPHLQRTVTRFADRREILFWEVINEPNCGEGRYDADCLETIGEWLNMSTSMVKAIDGCHMVATGMIGVGNYEADLGLYRKLHGKPAVEIVSVHRWAADEGAEELDVAEDLERPVFYGEVYEKAYDDGCAARKGRDSPRRRAERIVEDIEDAIETGVDGYLLWDFAAGRIQLTDGRPRDYCSSFGYPLDDPLWQALSEAGLPPSVPWR